MDLFGIFGLSNATILIWAAAIGVGATVVSLTSSALRRSGSRSAGIGRNGRTELHLASLGEGEPGSNAAVYFSGELKTPGAAAIEELFGDAVQSTSFFTAKADPQRLAESAADELSGSLEAVQQIGRIVLRAYDGGALEVAPLRRKLAKELKEISGALGSETWKRQGTRLMAGTAMPDQATCLVGTLFARSLQLKRTIFRLSKDPSADDLIGILDDSVSIVKANERATQFLEADAA